MKKTNEQGAEKKLNNNFIIFVVALASLPLTVFSQDWLPSQFLRDNSYYGSRLNASTTGYDDSFEIVTKFYQITGLQNQVVLLAFFQWLIATLCIFALKRKIPHLFDSKKSLIIGCIYFLLLPFYFGMYTKEIIITSSIFIYIALSKFNQNEKKSILYFLACFLPLGLLRPYMFLILMMSIATFSWAWRFGKYQLFVLPILLSSIVLTFEAWTGLVLKSTGVNLLSLRYQMVSLSPYVANSTIEPSIFSGSFIGNSIDLARVLLEILLPFSFASISIYSTFGIILSISTIYILSTTSYAKANDGLCIQFLKGFLLSYLAVALVFEPDVGSFLRHTVPYLIVILIIRGLGSNFNRYHKENE